MKEKTAVLWASIVRTVVPVVVGYVLALFVKMGFEVGDDLAMAVEGVITAVLTGAYYVGVRLLEVYVTPKFGWLLGLAKSPDHYTNDPQ